MPIRWYGPANPEDPLYRHFNRIVNCTLHAGVFAAVNSGLWFVQEMRHPWTHLALLTELWLALWVVQLVRVLVLRPRSEASASTPATSHPSTPDQP
ncbi:MAG: hypothetical protein VKK03_08050 [Synechococcus sp.]|nr:hypothetical protein [Synechococcus sp.]